MLKAALRIGHHDAGLSYGFSRSMVLKVTRVESSGAISKLRVKRALAFSDIILVYLA
jgi:hypothetical protein